MAEKHDAASDMDRIKDDLSTLRADFGELVSAAMDMGKHQAGTAKEKLEAGVAHLKKAAYKTAKQARAKGEEAVETAQETIAERPLTSVLIAFGAGVLVAKLLDRR